MEGGFYINSRSSEKTLKLEALEGNVPPLNLNMQNFNGRGIYHQHHQRPKTPIFDPYASSDSCSNSPNFDSPLIRHLYWSSGSSGGTESRVGRGVGGGFLSPRRPTSIENLATPLSWSPPVFKTTTKVEEDVLVMDGILVSSDKSNSSEGGGGVRIRSSLTSSDTGGRLLSSSSSAGSENSFYKMEKCRSWEDSGTCRFDSKCQFAHGKEELNTSHHLSKNNVEEQLCKSLCSVSCPYGNKCRFVHHQVNAAVSSIEQAPAAKLLPTTTATISPIKLESTINSCNSISTTDLTSSDWHPLDDGIAVAVPSASSEKTLSKEDVDAHILTFLYGPTVRKRLPVFTEFCPE